MTKKLALLLVFLLGPGLFLALPRTATAQDQDPPTRVARLNYLQGAVSFQPSGEQDWVDADTNRPLTTGDNLWADKDSRGEVHIGSTSIRLSSETGISFLNLDDRTAQIQLAQGTIEVHLRHLEPGNAFEIDTQNLAFTLTSAGEYQIQTNPDGTSTVIIVREGLGQANGAGESYDLTAGQQYTFTGTDELTLDAQAAPEFDSFEDWSQSRDQRENSSSSAQFVSRDIDGYTDLDDSGDWQADADYGAIWIPRGVAVGWTPYHYGHWVWIGPWGWTWVENEPWGFAPFHYGRWAFVRGNWGWVPGPVVVRPVYAPALVGFVGGGGGFSVAVGFGGGFSGVAWFPLGPRDVYIPGYRTSPRYVQMINVTNTRVLNAAQVTSAYNTYNLGANRGDVANRINYTYANNAAAVTAVPREAFIGARPVAAASIRVTPEQLESARVTETTPLAPTRSSYVASNLKVATAKPHVPFAQRPVVARLNPPAPIANRPAANVVHADSVPKGAQPPARQTNNLVTPEKGFNTLPRANTSNGTPVVHTNDNLTPAERGYDEKPAPSARDNANATPTDNSRQSDHSAQRENSAAAERSDENSSREHPAVKFTPPTRAKDDMYDVHPPLNHRSEAAPQQQQQQQHAAPARQEPAHAAPPPAAPAPAPHPKN